MKTYISKTFAAIAAVIAITACGGGNTTTADDESADSVSTDAAKPKTEVADTVEADVSTGATNVANSPTFNGVLVVSPDQVATVTSTMGGRIHKLNVIPGKAVRRGQVIAMLDDPDFITLQQTYLESSAQLECLRLEYDRQRNLASKEAASQKRVEQSRADFLSMKSRASAAEAQLRALGVDVKTIADGKIMMYLPVTAPISGYVTDLEANLGKYLEPGMPICNVINKSQPIIKLTVYEKDLSLIEVGTQLAFRVNGMGKATFSATVISVDQAVDKTDYSIKAYARVKDGGATFRPGMYVRAKVKK